MREAKAMHCLVMEISHVLPNKFHKMLWWGCTAFDAEVMGLTVALYHATLVPDATDIILYVDNKAALQSLLNPAIHPSQMCSILACQRL